jgi:2-succinyl-6-hydroxy-2,4-cyclohexadiene-1-carboxylate synthase
VNLPDSTYKWDFQFDGKKEGYPLLWLHGFMGSQDDWLELVNTHFPDYCNILVDLPGHGKSVIPGEANFRQLIKALLKQLSESGIESFTPIGYSMGGRIAYHIQYLAPERVAAMVLLSSAPGLKSRAERKQRCLDDDALMNRMDRSGISTFLEKWYSSPLFGEIKKNPEIFDKLCHERSHNDVKQLRHVLKLMGNGALPSLWNHVRHISVPTLLITGMLDQKYVELNREITQKIPGSCHHQVSDAGHAFHLEKPLETAHIIRHFLSDIIEGE